MHQPRQLDSIEVARELDIGEEHRDIRARRHDLQGLTRISGVDDFKTRILKKFVGLKTQ